MAVENTTFPVEVKGMVSFEASNGLDPTLLEKATEPIMLPETDIPAPHPLLRSLLDKAISEFIMPDRSQYSGTIE